MIIEVKKKKNQFELNLYIERTIKGCTHLQCQRLRQPWTDQIDPFGQSWCGFPGPDGPVVRELLADCTHAKTSKN